MRDSRRVTFRRQRTRGRSGLLDSKAIALGEAFRHDEFPHAQERSCADGHTAVLSVHSDGRVWTAFWSAQTPSTCRVWFLGTAFRLSLGDLCWRDIEQLDECFGEPGNVLCLVDGDVTKEVRVSTGVAVKPDMIYPLANRDR